MPFSFKVKTTNTGVSTLNTTGTVEPLVGGAHLTLKGNELVANGNALVYWNPALASGASSYVLTFCSGALSRRVPEAQAVTPSDYLLLQATLASRSLSITARQARLR
ncbi:hypothetical protein [Paraburkholderia fungorum]|uniref:hypothetical protein n=1 Tax=Paraburkholderia fungorum TaxID=134537 RepID=UPI0011C43CFE|nr:hypothetical protein [Paraburkholderia fungorum]